MGAAGPPRSSAAAQQLAPLMRRRVIIFSCWMQRVLEAESTRGCPAAIVFPHSKSAELHTERKGAAAA